ncbi:hypothetical protein GGTG_01570 [Gaeumannomyces tritici R3-111a-1]|uniref:Uncharacterized protein n=1 Tax=Gaeumannomyces tritici (strain R3-111a-1) TaxID=644352 RepID=J3NJY8_GAET3|nr:hypothetical protein GGTG_01570 [Gaeumannomyces tritici R3-111a-1]EJT81592.1 hypothetical protein GGTG_01570 [Gaeumannomyces tritici R3-111a-1]
MWLTWDSDCPAKPSDVDAPPGKVRAIANDWPARDENDEPTVDSRRTLRRGAGSVPAATGSRRDKSGCGRRQSRSQEPRATSAEHSGGCDLCCRDAVSGIEWRPTPNRWVWWRRAGVDVGDVATQLQAGSCELRGARAWGGSLLRKPGGATARVTAAIEPVRGAAKHAAGGLVSMPDGHAGTSGAEKLNGACLGGSVDAPVATPSSACPRLVGRDHKGPTARPAARCGYAALDRPGGCAVFSAIGVWRASCH